MLATPLETVPRGPGDLRRLADLATTHSAIEVVVGLPISLSGREGPAARSARDYARKLAAQLAPLPVRVVDERLSTVTAERSLASGGLRGRSRRKVVDQVAATVILQATLDTERSSGAVPGEPVQAEA